MQDQLVLPEQPDRRHNLARANVYTTLTAVQSGLQAVDGYLPLLGLDGPKRYFVGIENSAEARGLGGLPGSFAIAVVDHGAVSFTHFESDTALVGVSSGVDLGQEYRTRYGNSNGLANYQNSTMSPNFPSVARIWAGMWQTKTGEHVDGAIAVDPTALSYFLAATGPAVLADGTTVSAANIVQLTESTVYQRFATDNDGRKQYLLDIAAAVQKHIMAIWTSDAAVESQLDSAAVGGALPGPDRALAGVTVTNAGGNKLDYYLDRTISYVRTGCGATRTVVATVTLHNAAPATGLPAYVTNRSDGRAYPTRPGDNRLLVSAYSTAGSALQSVTVDGTPVRYWVAPELGHPVFTVDVELPRAATRVIEYRYTEPAPDGPVQMLNQPLVRPAKERVTDASCR